MRKEFEIWYRTKFPNVSNVLNGELHDTGHAGIAWQAWQAGYEKGYAEGEKTEKQYPRGEGG